MLKKIQSFFEKNFIAQGTTGEPSEQQLNLSAAALLIEMVVQDDEISESEVVEVKASLITQFGLSETAADSLYQLAHEEKEQATDYYQFTRLIAEHYTQRRKIELVESLWRVAFADQILHKYEEQMVRRISDLIHVSHKDFIQAKLRAEKK
ncbi:hypothetical protein MNBD_GAMMA07-954 [hydrothermal vent metagenome]|uniref:Co-chaperone DjlA N-terminal domain-containing protein n=1 Tax=hydrothermal vent metagenome TaxID=652676 RepID=A0A3B0WZR6_9ZZZZ